MTPSPETMNQYWSSMSVEAKALTIAALESSIRKWERIAGGSNESIFGNNCALCDMFYHHEENDESCGGCPMRAATGLPQCEGSPWGGVRDLQYIRPDTLFQIAAQKELDFLKSLRPKPESP